MQLPDECGESFLWVFWHGGIWCYLCDVCPQCWVDVVGGGLELSFGVGEFVEEIAHVGVASVTEDGGGYLLPAGNQGGVFDVEGECKSKSSIFDGREKLYFVVWGKCGV